VVHPYYETEDSENPAGVEILDHLQPVEVGEKLRYPTPNVSDSSPELYLSVNKLDLIVGEMSVDAGEYERFAVALQFAAGDVDVKMDVDETWV